MPRIGMRIIKSALAVFICFLIYLIRGEGLPFYSTIAAIMCMQPGISNTRTASRNRIIGTFVGGIFGMFLLVFERKYMVGVSEIFRFLLISVAIIPVIYTSVLLEHKQASHTSCIVFLSIVVNHAADVSPYAFTLSRVIDTLIGIFVALAINGIKIPRKKNKDILLITELEDTLLNSNGQVSGYAKVKLNEMIADGAQITLATNKTSADIVPLMNSLEVRLPIITMDGAAIYDWSSRSYSYVEAISHETSLNIIDSIRNADINFFANTIVNDVIHIYYDNKEKLLPMKNYILTNLPKKRKTVYFTIIDTGEKLEELKKLLEKQEYCKELRFIFEDYSDGYKVMKIFSSKANKGKAVLELKKRVKCTRVVTFGNDNKDIAMIKVSDMSYAVSNGTEEVKELASTVINSNDLDAVVKIMIKLFYIKRIS
ncbi:MAG: HAD-IIB family hydrolase [Clostridium sp.]